KSVVRAAVIYGANAAGKSALVRAMAAAQALVKAEDPRPPIIEPFRFDRDLAGKPTSFEFRFLVNERVFIYGFDIKSRAIQSEWLSVVDGSDECLIVERTLEGKTRPADDVGQLFPKDKQLPELLAA